MAERRVKKHAVVPESEALPFLPDDVLIKIFKYLSRRELFSVRAVCRRWAGLALHPDLWRHQDLGKFQEPSFCKAALRLAPCARSLTLHCPTQLPTGLLRSTLCAVKTLRLYPDENSALTCSKALRRQASLGRLREVTASCHESCVLGQLRALFRALLATQGLTELELSTDHERLEWLPEGRLVAPSLKKITFWSKETGPSRFAVLRHLLDSHAPTLEVVDVSAHPVITGPSLFCGSATWLEKAHRLRDLRCPVVMQDMEALAQFEHLQALTLRLGAPSDVSDGAEIRKYLCQAKQLKCLTLQCKDNSVAQLAVDLVRDVASCRPSALQALSLDFDLHDDRWLQVLLSILPKLGALRLLRVRADGAATLRLMQCLSAMERPELSRTSSVMLYITRKFGGSEGVCCSHAWLHKNRGLIGEFLEEFPGLHLKMNLYDTCISCLCPAGGEDCDNVRVRGILSPFVLFGHSKNYVCDLPHGTGSPIAELERNRLCCR